MAARRAIWASCTRAQSINARRLVVGVNLRYFQVGASSVRVCEPPPPYWHGENISFGAGRARARYNSRSWKRLLTPALVSKRKQQQLLFIGGCRPQNCRLVVLFSTQKGTPACLLTQKWIRRWDSDQKNCSLCGEWSLEMHLGKGLVSDLLELYLFCSAYGHIQVKEIVYTL